MSSPAESGNAGPINGLKRFISAVQRHPRLCEALFIPCLLAGIFWLFLGRFLGGDYSVATWLDNTHFLLPLFAYISKSFAAGEFPYWIHSIAGGIPLYNTPQFSLLYPLYFFHWNLYDSPIDTLLRVHYVVLLHVAILWMNTYVMMRIFSLRVIASALGATLFAFCGNTYQYLYWVNIISPYSWLPLALGSVYLVLEDKYPKTGLVLGWISIYLLVSASPAQPLIHLVYCAAFLVVAFWIAHRKNEFRRRAPVRNLILLAVGSVLLTAATIVPTAIFSRSDMVRWTELGPIVGKQRIPFRAFLTGQTSVRELAEIVFPMHIDHVIGDSFLGVLPILLVFFSVFKAKRNWIVIPLLCLALYTLLSSTGVNLGLAYVNYLIPLWNKIREPGRHLVVFALAACTLAAFGFEHLTAWSERSGKFDYRKHALAFGLFAIFLSGSYWVRRSHETLIGDSILLWSLIAFLVVLCVSRLLPRLSGLRTPVLAAIVIYPALHYPVSIVKISEGDYFQQDNLRSHRVLQEVAKIGDVHDYRLVVADKQFSTQYWSMNASYYGLRTFEAFMNPLPYREFSEMFAAAGNPRHSQLLGAKYYLNCLDPSATPEDYNLEREIEGCTLYSTNRARPHYFLSTEMGLSYKDSREFLDMIARNDDYLSKVSAESKEAPQVAAWLGDPRPSLISETVDESRSQDALSLRLKTNRRSVLVLNEYFRDEWKVRVNGRTEKPLRVNLNQIGVLVPEGENQIRFEYYPRLFLWLVYLQRGTLGVLAVGLVGMTLRRIFSGQTGRG